MTDLGAMATVRLKYLMRDTDRHGNERLYVRRRGFPKVRLLVDEANEHFATAYAAGLKGQQWQPPCETAPEKAKPTAREKAKPGSFRWMCDLYFASGEFLSLDKTTKSQRRNVLSACFDEPLNPPGVMAPIGDCPIARFTSAHVRALRDRVAAMPGAANNRLKAMGPVFAWATEAKHAT